MMNVTNLYVYADNPNPTDNTTDIKFTPNEKISEINGNINGKIIPNGNGGVNGLTTYQNGNVKSDIAVIDIIEDGKSFLF